MSTDWGLLGTMFGAAIADGMAKSRNNREMKNGLNDLNNQFNINDNDIKSAQNQVTEQLKQYIGINPKQGVANSKINYAQAQEKYNRALATYQVAKDVGDQSGMQVAQSELDQLKFDMDNSHSAAEMYRAIAGNKGVAMDGYSADDPLQSQQDTGNKYSFQLPSSMQKPQDDFERKLAGLSAINTEFQSQQPTSENFEKQLANMAFKTGDAGITFDDIDKYAGGRYSEQVNSLAKQLAAQRYSDPNFSVNLEYMLRDKGYGEKTIAYIMQHAAARQKSHKETALNSLIGQISNLRAAGDYGTANALQVQLLPLVGAKASDYNAYIDKASPHIGFNNVDAGGQTYVSQYDSTGQLPTQTAAIANTLSPNTRYQGQVAEANNIRTNETSRQNTTQTNRVRTEIANNKNTLEFILHENGSKGNKGNKSKEPRYGYNLDGSEVNKDQATFKTKANNIAAKIATIDSLKDSGNIEDTFAEIMDEMAKLDSDYKDNPDISEALDSTMQYLNNAAGEKWLSKNPNSRYTFYTDDGPVQLSLEQWINNYKPNF